MTEEAKNKRILLVENRRVWSKKARCRPQNLTERHHFSHSITSKPMRFNDTTSKLKCTNALIHLRDRTLHSDIRTAMRQRATTTRDNTTRKKHFSMYVLGDFHPFEVERERERGRESKKMQQLQRTYIEFIAQNSNIQQANRPGVRLCMLDFNRVYMDFDMDMDIWRVNCFTCIVCLRCWWWWVCFFI